VNFLDIFLSLTSLTLGILTVAYYLRLKSFKKLRDAQDEALKNQSYEIVHELRAPLSAIKDAAILLHDMPGKLTPTEQDKMLSLIKNECLQLLDQVTSFLDVSKVMNNKLTIKKEPNDLSNLLKEKVMIFTPQAKASGIDLTDDIDDHLPLIMYDSRYISQVINNVLSNSLKYTPQGGTITVSAKTDDKNIIVSVFDNGLGVADEKQKALFSKFTSLNTKNSAIASSGLGLYVVKGIIEAHGGSVNVETHQGRGYKVSFSLPLEALPASLAQPAPVN
jgi:two-component system, OmpR family, sensor histidine kinase VicK